MSNILITWLNTEVDLSKKITNMEEDFQNGYLLGELLHKFNQLTNLNDFRDENDRSAAMNNFARLHDVLRNVGVKFDSNTTRDIMNKKPGVIANLLYEIRSNLEKKGVNPENISLKKSSHFQEMYSPMKFRQEIPPYDKFDKKFYIDSLQRKTISQKEIDMKKKLQKYEDFKNEQIKKIQMDQINEECRKKQELDINIKNERNKNQRFHGFLQQFEEKGINNWKNNMLQGKERELKDIQFQLAEAFKIKNNLQKGINHNIAVYKREVNEFEKNFGKNGKRLHELEKLNANQTLPQINNTNEIANANINTILPNNLNNISLQKDTFGSAPYYDSVENRSSKITEKIYNKMMRDTKTKMERNRRRRKIIVEQGKAQLEIENKRREEQYINKLGKQSNQEKQLTYETYRVNQSKNIIKENRNLREEMYKKRLEQNIEFEKINEENFLKFNVECFKKDMEKEDGKKSDLELSQKQKKRNANNKYCEDMVKLIIDITDKAYEYQQINDVEEVDERVWREWNNLFKNNESVLNTEIIGKKEEKEEEEEEKKEEEKEEFKEEEEKENVSNKNVNPEENNNNNENNNENQENQEQKEENEENQEQKEENQEQKEEDINININSIYNNTFYSIFSQNENVESTKIDKILDECEFFEYTNNIGQWDPKLIPSDAFKSITSEDLKFEYVNLNETNQNNKKDAKKDPKKDPKKKDSNENNFDEILQQEKPEDLIIPNTFIKNIYLGDLIDILIDIKYDEEFKKLKELKENSKNIFRYIPIKIALIGQDFSGKKTQAKILSQNFPFKIYDLVDLVKDALSFLSSSHESKTNFLLSNTQLTSNEKKNSAIAQMRNEQAEEEKKYSKIKELARTIKKSLLNGEAISDEVYAELLIEYIKIDFPVKEDYEVSKEIIDRVERKEQILEEIEKNKEQNANRPKAFEKRDRELNEELMKISIEASKGFVLVNYPNTYNQAKILENKLSGYVNENESPELKSTKLKKIFEILLDKSEKILPPFKLITGGFDFIFYLNVPGNECVRRAIGRRVFFDEKTGMKVTYHLEDNKPPVDSGKNICEKLKKIDDDNHSESSLVTRHLAFENSINQVVNFYQPFGFEEKGLKSFEIIDGNRELDYVTQDILSYVNQLVELNEQKDQEIYDNQEEESYENDEENMSENLMNNLENEEKKEEEKKEENDEKKEEEKENEEKKEENEENKENISQINEEDKNIVPNENEEEKILDPFSEYTNKIQKIKETLNPSLSDVLLKIWSKLFENYVNECKSIFKFLRVQRDQISINYNLICQKFIEFLKRPSKKQILLLDYQMKYNKFLDDYPDIKDDPQVKEEHHQEVDDLNDKIYEIIENRKNEAVDERKKIMTSGWIENEMEKFFMALERLFQNEIDKFIGSMQIMRDYYHNLDNKPLIELPFSTIDIIKEEADSTPLEEFDNNIEDENNNNNENNNENNENESENDKAKAAEEINEKEIEKNLPKSYPRLEKLYKECLKVQFQYEEAIREAEKQKQLNEAEANKKAAAANKGKKDKNAKNEANEEEKIEPSEHEEEMKQALSNEKAKYKYKITLLKYWGISTLKNLRRLSLSVYNKLEDWIILAIKAENEALNQLTEMLKENIENESKIKYELALDTFDVIVNMDIQNYIELPPKLLPAKEVINHEKFNITQLQILMEELKTYLIEDENNSNFIRSSTFINIFIKKFIASRNDNDVYYGIPNLLKNLNFYNYFKFIKKLDPDNSDLVSLKQIGTYFALLNSNVPSEENIKSIVEQCEKIVNYYENPEIEKEQFVNINFWFDENEKSETLPNHEDFHREVKLKEVLFDINKNNDEKVNINNFIDILNLHCLNLNSEKFKDKNYYEVLFF